jgi:hypothetical protein
VQLARDACSLTRDRILYRLVRETIFGGRDLGAGFAHLITARRPA